MSNMAGVAHHTRRMPRVAGMPQPTRTTTRASKDTASHGRVRETLDSCIEPREGAVQNPARPKPEPGQPWLQVLSHESKAYDLAYAFSEVFEETQLCKTLGRKEFSVRMCQAGLGSVGGPPRAQLASLRRCQGGRVPSVQQQQILLEASRRRAMNTVKGSWKSTRSALYTWAEFCESFKLPHFPVSAGSVRMFSTFIQHGPTLGKYLQHLRWAQTFLGISNDWWQGGIQQVVRGALKSTTRLPARRPVLRERTVRAMIRDAEARRDYEIADAFAIARGFLFRVPSEMLPLCIHDAPSGNHRVRCGGSETVVSLTCRKNDLRPVELRRACVCEKQGRRLCAHHHMCRAVDRARKLRRQRIFSFSYSFLLGMTKYYAARAGVPDAGTHGFRRGAAQDMALQGCQLFEILKAGGWRSASFMHYMNAHELEAGACAQLVADRSDSDSE